MADFRVFCGQRNPVPQPHTHQDRHKSLELFQNPMHRGAFGVLILRDRSQVPGLSDDGRKGPVARSGQAGSAVRRKRRSCRRGAAGRIAKARQTDPHRARTQFRGAGPMAAVRPHWPARIVTRTGGDKALPWLRELGRRRPVRAAGRLANRAVIGPRPGAPRP